MWLGGALLSVMPTENVARGALLSVMPTENVARGALLSVMPTENVARGALLSVMPTENVARGGNWEFPKRKGAKCIQCISRGDKSSPRGENAPTPPK